MIRALYLIVLFITFTASAHAEDEICPAVYPCLESGELNPIFNTSGFCGDKFRAVCSEAKTSKITDELVSCQNENVSFKDKEEKLSKEISSLRKKLRNARRK